MKPESVKRIMRIIDAEVQRAGFKDWDEAMKFAKTALNAPGGAVPFAADPSADRLVSRSELEQLYSNEPEPTQSELEHQIKQIRQRAGELRRFLMQAVKKEIPSDPGGRKSVQGSPQEQERRNRLVTSFIGKGMKITEALKRVARKENVSLSTMQRVWGKRRGPLNEPEEDAPADKPPDASSRNNKTASNSVSGNVRRNSKRQS
jgi:hypothetical protein